LSELKPNRLGLAGEGENTRFDAKSLLASLGGWAGIVEATVPTTLYVITYTIWQNVWLSAVLAGATSLGFIVRQLFVRKSLATAIAGAVSVLIAVMLPLRQGGHASDYFALGLLTNLGYFTAMLLSIFIRFPIIGVLVSGFTSKGFGWRKQRNLLRRFDAATALWVGLFGVRLAVEFPLFLANALEPLGIVKIVMGVPLYAVTLWLTWLVIRPTFTAAQ
jgi:hypothetical protein